MLFSASFSSFPHNSLTIWWVFCSCYFTFIFTFFNCSKLVSFQDLFVYFFCGRLFCSLLLFLLLLLYFFLCFSFWDLSKILIFFSFLVIPDWKFFYVLAMQSVFPKKGQIEEKGHSFGSMGGKRSIICCLNLEILVWFLLIFAFQLSDETDPGDGKEQTFTKF